ncbi:MAG: DNA gyrase subunit A [Actinobacteria bacterium]|jgi:DNA gyrase subunit A|nr:DNA gyrase subunit A [Actinomycetota bacterium]
METLEGRIEQVEIADEMKAAYLDYAMSVIVGRALPDVRDGLKPVHRRVLFGMHDSGMQPNRPYRKCARIVGDVMGNFHPHGDASIYDALVRMAQDFSIRYLLVDGHGNFGSVDGDSAAAMRYTECRLSRIATEMLRDIEAETVGWIPNYDESREEPAVLPARFPNLLVNGSSGIAVGMATNIPPHNLRETIAACVALIDEPGLTSSDLMKYMKGPDFPTGGIIMGNSGIREAYDTGRGRVVIRARAHSEPLKQGKTAIIVTEIPYQVNKAQLIEKIAELVRTKSIPEISDLRDESDRSGMRVVIELKREAIAKVVLNKLFKHTSMQSTFGVNMLALADGVPRTLSLKEMLCYYIAHQKDVIVRRTKYELDKAKKRAHILEGLLVAISNLDEVIRIIRSSEDTEAAKMGLMERFGLSDEQAQAIVDLRLRNLTALERHKIEEEHRDLMERIAYLEGLLADEALIYDVIKEELIEIQRMYGDDRRTEILPAEDEIDIEDMIAVEEMAISITASGYVKRLPVSTYRSQIRGGIGVMGMDLKEGDYVEHLFITTTHHFLLFITSRGKIYRQKVHELPLGSRQSKGRHVANLLPLASGEMIKAVIATKDYTDAKYLVFATKSGIVKKTRFLDYATTLKADGIIAINLEDDDELVAVAYTNGHDDLILVSTEGKAIRFHEYDVRPTGRNTMGVRGMRMPAEHSVLGMAVAEDDADIFCVTSGGYGKRTPVSSYPTQKRGGLGVKTIKDSPDRGDLVGVATVRNNHELMLISQDGVVIRVPVEPIRTTGRNTMGVRVMKLRGADKISSMARVVSDGNGQSMGVDDSPEGDSVDIEPEDGPETDEAPETDETLEADETDQAGAD